MSHRSHLLSTLAFFLFVALPPAAHGAGDPTRGATLYATTYGCAFCHTIPPLKPLISGSTPDGLLASIMSVQPMFTMYDATLAKNPTDLADIAAYIASVLQPRATTPDLNQHGLTGSWYEPATSGQGMEVEVFPDDLTPGTGLVQVSWFTYDTVAGGADHQRWYTASGPVVTGQPSASLTIYQNTGGNFNAPPTTAGQAVGTATLSFATCSSGQLSYSFSDGTGRTGTIPLTRLTQNVTCATTTPYATNADFALSGNWFDPATSGQGFTVEVNPNSNAIFTAWYTYAPNGVGAGAAGQRWYTALGTFAAGARSLPIQIYENTGGIFNAPPTTMGQQVGSGTMVFQSCSAATLSYTFTGGSSSGASGTITLSRVGPVPPGCT